MKVYLILGVLCLLCIVQLYDNRATPASSAHMAALLGGEQCYYPTPATCANAIPEEYCWDFCEWLDLLHPEDPEHEYWGLYGMWRCPEGMDYDIRKQELSTTFKTSDTQDLGWNGDQEKASSEDCNTKYACDCPFEYGPGWPQFSGTAPLCETYGNKLQVPQGTFREVTGPQDCNPTES